jgi:hypothetical protein
MIPKGISHKILQESDQVPVAGKNPDTLWECPGSAWNIGVSEFAPIFLFAESCFPRTMIPCSFVRG